MYDPQGHIFKVKVTGGQRRSKEGHRLGFLEAKATTLPFAAVCQALIIMQTSQLAVCCNVEVREGCVAAVDEYLMLAYIDRCLRVASRRNGIL